jgi:hypothetical protein
VDDGAGLAVLEEVRDGLLGCVDGVYEVDVDAGVSAAIGGVFGDGRSGRVPEIGEGLGRGGMSDTDTLADEREGQNLPVRRHQHLGRQYQTRQTPPSLPQEHGQAGPIL